MQKWEKRRSYHSLRQGQQPCKRGLRSFGLCHVCQEGRNGCAEKNNSVHGKER